ncbi:MAG: SusF/SusE family outer membrane protein, partial [Sphingobacteriales bacterium]
GKLTAGEFKVPTVKGDWGGAFYRPVENYPAETDKRVQLNAGDPDNKWQIKVEGNYKLTLNLRDMTMDIVNTDPPVAPFDKLWLLGDASPGGWSLDNASPMTVNPSDAFIFTWEGKLVAGDFKIATEKSFDGAFYRPTTNAPALSETAIQLNAGEPDHKWNITTATAGNYKITLNLRNSTISIVNTDKPQYTKLWIIGDASPGGWSLDNAVELVVSPTDPFTFTYTGALTAGEFKIATEKNFGGKFYRPTTNHPELTDPLVQLSAGDPDHKWQITSAGNYKLTLNTKNLTMTIVRQ